MHPDFVVATEMLAVPRPRTCTAAQVDGTACVWCGDLPDVSLGTRLYVTDGAVHRWMPRACTSCTRNAAAHTHRAHREECFRCTPMEHCHDSQALYVLSLPRLQPAVSPARPRTP